MSLSVRERHELQSIENGLTGSDPRLASLLAIFARLTDGEEMPARERIRAGWRLASGRLRRRDRRPRLGSAGGPAGRPRRRLDWQRVGPVLWVLIAIGLIAGALAATSGGGRACAGPPAVCAGLAPAPPPAHSRQQADGPLAVGAGGSPGLPAGPRPSGPSGG